MKTTTNENKENKKDSLKELEELLEKDVMSVDDDDRLIPKPEMQRIIVRFSVFVVLAIILFAAKMIDDIGILLVALLLFAVMEGMNVMKIIKSKKNKIQFKPKK